MISATKLQEKCNKCKTLSSQHDDEPQTRPRQRRPRTRRKLIISNWLDYNRKLVDVMSQRLQLRTEYTQFLLIKLLHSNFGKFLELSTSLHRQHYAVPLNQFYCLNEALWAHLGLFNAAGYLISPLKPQTAYQLLEMVQKYLRVVRENSELNGHGHCSTAGSLYDLLGEHDELVRLLRSLNAGRGCVQRLLHVIEHDLDLHELRGTCVCRRRYNYKGMSDFYADIVENKTHDDTCKCLEDDTYLLFSNGPYRLPKQKAAVAVAQKGGSKVKFKIRQQAVVHLPKSQPTNARHSRLKSICSVTKLPGTSAGGKMVAIKAKQTKVRRSQLKTQNKFQVVHIDMKQHCGAVRA